MRNSRVAYSEILDDEWVYSRPYANEHERELAYMAWLHYYNHHRPPEVDEFVFVVGVN